MAAFLCDLSDAYTLLAIGINICQHISPYQGVGGYWILLLEVLPSNHMLGSP